MTPYVFQRGETISLALDALTGDPLSVSAISASMKMLAPGRSSVDAGAPIAATFTVTPRSASASDPAGWNLTVSASISAGLSPGTYLADARVSVGGGVIITSAIAIRIAPSVSA
jgi:hypothetical protein